jgi:F-box domain
MASPLPLYSIPPEIWLNILAHLSEPDFLSLKLSSTYLRSVITDNASTICNNLIMKHYAQEASIIGTSFQDGWLVPTHPAIFREEKQLSRYASRSNSLARSRSRDPSPPPQGPHEPPISTKLSEPGPQYLRFLIEYSFEIRVANSMFINVPAQGKAASCCGNDDETPKEKFDRWIGLYTIRRFLTRLQKITEGKSNPFPSFGSDNSGEQNSAMLKATQEGLAWFYE